MPICLDCDVSPDYYSMFKVEAVTHEHYGPWEATLLELFGEEWEDCE